jgi:phosphoribosylformylglycinamidine synthase
MILGCGIVEDITKAVTADFKKIGSCIFIVGRTKDEMGASLLFRKFGGEEGAVPGVDIPALKRTMDKLLKAMDERIVLSCHDCSDGGLAVAVAEMCISGQIGAEIDLSAIDLPLQRALYSESNTRWIVEVDGMDVTRFTEIMGDDAFLLGITKGDSLHIKNNGTRVGLEEMRAAWNDPIWNIMGGAKQ